MLTPMTRLSGKWTAERIDLPRPRQVLARPPRKSSAYSSPSTGSCHRRADDVSCEMLTGPRLRDGGSTSAGPELYSSRLRMDNQWDPAVDWSSRTLSKRRVRRDRCIQNDYFFQRVRGSWGIRLPGLGYLLTAATG